MVFSKIAWVLMGIFLLAGLINAYQVYSEKEDFVSKFVENPKDTGLSFLKFTFGMQTTTGAWQYEWINPPEEKKFILEEFPYPDAYLFIIPTIFALIIFSIGKGFANRTETMGGAAKAWTITWILIIIFFIGLIIAQDVIAYHLYYEGAEGLGMSREQAEQARTAQIATVENSGLVPILLMLGLLSAFTITKAIATKKKE